VSSSIDSGQAMKNRDTFASSAYLVRVSGLVIASWSVSNMSDKAMTGG